MNKLKWLIAALAVTVLTATTVSGSLSDESADGQKLYIVQSELQRENGGLADASDRELLPAVYEETATENVLLKGRFTVTDMQNNTTAVDISVEKPMYTAANALDHIVVVTNTGNTDGYIRTWFAFEMGDLTKEEFEASVLLNQNKTDWEWDAFEYGVEIGGERYAVVCAKYKDALAAGATTQPSLLQIMLYNTVTNETAQRLDGNGDGKYEIKAFSRAVSDKDAWGAIEHPWSN